jgi:hypothetical protein
MAEEEDRDERDKIEILTRVAVQYTESLLFACILVDIDFCTDHFQKD